MAFLVIHSIARESLDAKWKLQRFQNVRPRVEVKNDLHTSFERLSRNSSRSRATPQKPRANSSVRKYDLINLAEKRAVQQNAANNLSLLLRNNEKDDGKLLPNFNNTSLRKPSVLRVGNNKRSANDLNQSSLL